MEVLLVYLKEGWQVEILPWLVSFCGLLDSASTKEIVRMSASAC
jgi:hypothetical protein